MTFENFYKSEIIIPSIISQWRTKAQVCTVDVSELTKKTNMSENVCVFFFFLTNCNIFTLEIKKNICILLKDTLRTGFGL